MNFDNFKTKEELRMAIEEAKKEIDIDNFDETKIIMLNRMTKYYNNWEVIKWLEGNVENYRRNYKE